MFTEGWGPPLALGLPLAGLCWWYRPGHKSGCTGLGGMCGCQKMGQVFLSNFTACQTGRLEPRLQGRAILTSCSLWGLWTLGIPGSVFASPTLCAQPFSVCPVPWIRSSPPFILARPKAPNQGSPQGFKATRGLGQGSWTHCGRCDR